MRNKLILLGLMAVITALILTQILKSGTEHVDVVDTAQTLQADNEKLVEENGILESDVKQLEQTVSTAEEQLAQTPVAETVEVIKKVRVYIHDTIVIHDTVVIKEQKNFWGKTKSDTL
jgi:predicted PurR-regulated permease PerM